MGSIELEREIHVVIVTCPAQGHINPLLQFAKHLVHQGLKVTVPVILTNPITTNPIQPPLTVDHVSLLPYHDREPESLQAYWERRQDSIREYLKQLLKRCYVSCIVYDSIMTWVVDVIKEFGVLGAAFFTQSCAVNSVYFHVSTGRLLDVEPVVAAGGSVVLRSSELPSFVTDQGKYPAVLKFLSDQFARLDEVDWIFANTFDSLEQEEVKWMGSQFPFKNIGPMIPSIYLDGKLPNDKDYGVNMFKSNKDSNIITKWLDSKGYNNNNSIIYVSFGSAAQLGNEQMEELACGLKQSNKFFLWVVRESEIHKLPTNFIEETAEKGLVVNWCSQLKVLAHQSIGCFVSHCGWNSTLEALSLGVPVVAMPQWTDQPTNAKYVEDVWKIGKRVKMDQHGICTRDQIEVCINEVMEGEGSKEIRENLKKWREMAKVAMSEGGSSNLNINHFVEELSRRALSSLNNEQIIQ